MRVKTSVEMFSLRLPIARGVGLKFGFGCLDDIFRGSKGEEVSAWCS